MDEAGLHRHTPTITAMDPRGLISRTVRYARESTGAMAESRIERTVHDPAGRIESQWDARLSAAATGDPAVRPNVSTLWSLGGLPLLQVRADAGPSAKLHEDSGAEVAHWDGRGTFRTLSYDALARPVAAHEQLAGDAGRCIERWRYGGIDASTSNGCGRLLGHDDPAGRHAYGAYSLTGMPQLESRWFLRNLERPDWPAGESDGGELLQPDANETQRQHDATGLLLHQLNAEGCAHSKRYTVAGLSARQSILLPDAGEQLLFSDIQYDADQRIVSQTLSGGMVAKTTYDPASGFLVRMVTLGARGGAVQDLAYSYDPRGNVRELTDATVAVRYWGGFRTDGTESFRYDTLDQLVEASGREGGGMPLGPCLPDYQPIGAGVVTNYVQRYTYDTGGNLVRMRHTGVNAHTMVVTPSSRSNRALPLGDDGSPPDEDAIAAAFDGCGNLRWLQPGGSELHWTGRNELGQVSGVRRAQGDDDTERYIYDGNSHRLRKVTSRAANGAIRSTEVRYLPGREWHTDEITSRTWIVMAVASGHATVCVTRWLEGRPEDALQDMTRYALGDRLGSVRAEIDTDGAPISLEAYYPFGGTAWRATGDVVRADYRTVRHAGKERDESGLYAYRFRYYAPWTCRWISADPGGEIDTLNLFGFVRNNPASTVDRHGLMWQPLGDFELPSIDDFDEGMLPPSESHSSQASVRSTELRRLEAWQAREDVQPFEPDTALADARPGELWRDTSEWMGKAFLPPAELYFFDPELETRLSTVNETFRARHDLVRDHFHHGVLPGNSHRIKSTSRTESTRGYDEFDITYTPEKWIRHSVFKRSRSRDYFVSDIMRFQYEYVSKRAGFFGQLPSVVEDAMVVNLETQQIAEALPNRSQGMLKAYLEKMPSTKGMRFTFQDFGLEPRSVARCNEDLFYGLFWDLAVKVGPEASRRSPIPGNRKLH
jgi:insecticidal toxin complex protein TccC